MKKKKVWMYVASFIIPIIIFSVCALINKYVPFGNEQLNSYDSFTQYPGILLEYIRAIRNHNIFYSWSAGLGFNLFGTITYYTMSPLNLFALLATPQNYYMFIAIITIFRFGLLGLTMAFYLDKRGTKMSHVILFSTIYALMGYTSTYYYNFLWIDSVIMLPLVMHGLDKLLEGKSSKFYIITLTITILINYYIGYMICIFSLIWFLYNLIHVKNKKEVTKRFFMSSVLAGLMSTIIILPTAFALLTGKAELYDSVNYLGVSRNTFTFLYTLTSGTYHNGDQSYGPALIYSTIFVLMLTVFYFFNKKFSKQEKLATLIIIIFFYLSFSVNLLNFAWQLFQKPIWWQSRFAFTFSFFLIVLASRTLPNIKYTDFKTKWRLLILILLIIGIVGGAFVKWDIETDVQSYTYIYLGFSILLIIEQMFLLDKEYFLKMIVIFTVIELSLNTFNSLKNNYRYMAYTNYQYIKEEVPKLVEDLNKENDNFYRMEFTNDYSSNDGMYFGFNGINYFNSARNINTINLMESLGVMVYDKCHIELKDIDPFILSLFNIKYLYGNDIDYYKEIRTRVYENPYPLALGFMVDKQVKNLELDQKQGILNRNVLLKTFLATNEDFYTNIDIDDFTKSTYKKYTDYTFEFIGDKDLIVIPNLANQTKIELNGEKINLENGMLRIEKGDKVKVAYEFLEKYKKENITLVVLDIEKYENAMKTLEQNTLQAKTNTNGHILEGTITVQEDDPNYLFTSIEYEKGMKVYVDGKKQDPDIILGALIGLELEPGEHEITIDYIPRGLIPGAIVSFVSLVVTVVYLQKQKDIL